MDIIIHFFRSYPEMAIFLTLGIGFWIGSLKYKTSLWEPSLRFY